MARMLMRALELAGYSAFVASRLVSYSKRHEPEFLSMRRAAAQEEAERLVRLWRLDGIRPDLWFCYHPYDKAPDWLGMELCTKLGIPMVTAEACKTGQGPNGEWLPWRAEAQRGLMMAAVNLVMKPTDMDYLSRFLDAGKIVPFPPFIAEDLLVADPDTADPWPPHVQSTRLISVGMMRPGAKFASYGILAEALGMLRSRDWSLAIVGDGPLRREVENLFSGFVRDRVRFLGEKTPGQVLALMAKSDILAWPGCREAYGMVYLEAASRSVPAVALNTMGVPSVVEHERTGLLAEPAAAGEFAAQLDRAIGDRDLRARLGAGARAFITGERSAETAARRLRAAIEPIFGNGGE